MALLPRVGPIQVATSRILVPKEVQVHRSPVTGHLATGQSPTRPGYQSLGQCSDDYKSVNHRSPSSSQRSLDLEKMTAGRSQHSLVNLSQLNWPLVTSHQPIYQTSVSDTHAIGMEFTTNRSNLDSEHSCRHKVQNPTDNPKRILLPLEPD